MPSSHSHRVYRGLEIERQVCALFGLRYGERNGHGHPDVLDYERGVVGEVKSFGDYERVVLSLEQFGRYSRFAREAVAPASLDGSRGKKRENGLRLFYFFAFFDDDKIKDVYVVPEKSLAGIIRKKSVHKTRWNMKSPDVAKIRVLEDRRQKLLDITNREEAAKRIVQGNKRGAWVRIEQNDLKRACPEIIETGEGILVHYRDRAPKFLYGIT